MTTDPEGVEQSSHRPSRRAVLGTAAAGAAAAWALPSILTIDAAAAFTCSPLIWANGDLDGTDPVTKPIGSTTVSADYDPSGLGGATGSVSSPGNHASPLGNVSNFIQLDLTITTPGEYESIIFTFAAPVFSLAFTLLNIDQSGVNGADWIDEVHLYGKLGGSSGTYQGATFSNVGADVTATPNFGSDTGGTYDLALGTSGPTNPAGTSTTGNADVLFTTGIDFLEIRYIGSGGTQPQLIGISDLNGCA